MIDRKRAGIAFLAAALDLRPPDTKESKTISHGPPRPHSPPLPSPVRTLGCFTATCYNDGNCQSTDFGGELKMDGGNAPALISQQRQVLFQRSERANPVDKLPTDAPTSKSTSTASFLSANAAHERAEGPGRSNQLSGCRHRAGCPDTRREPPTAVPPRTPCTGAVSLFQVGRALRARRSHVNTFCTSPAGGTQQRIRLTKHVCWMINFRR
jgi:hypothetical protein